MGVGAILGGVLYEERSWDPSVMKCQPCNSEGRAFQAEEIANASQSSVWEEHKEGQ